MLTIRPFARSAPRIVNSLTATSLRQTARPSTFVKSASWSGVQRASAFSSSASREVRGSQIDSEVIAKLNSELQFEDEVRQNNQDHVPASIKDFLSNTAFKLEDTPGKEEVKLTRNFGDEKITVTFSISDLSNFDPDSMYDDNALEDEYDPSEVQNSNKQSGVQAAGGARSANAEEEMDEEEGELGESPAPPCHLTIVVEKPGQKRGALSIDATAQEGAISVENIYFYEDSKLAHAGSPDTIHARSNLYPGPPFGTLDEDLQILMERYLEERGITQALAVFVPDYMDVKEQREYVRWLTNVKSFIDV